MAYENIGHVVRVRIIVKVAPSCLKGRTHNVNVVREKVVETRFNALENDFWWANLELNLIFMQLNRNVL